MERFPTWFSHFFFQTFRSVYSSRRTERFRNVHKYHINIVSTEGHAFPLHSYLILINTSQGSEYSPCSFYHNKRHSPGGLWCSCQYDSKHPWLRALGSSIVSWTSDHLSHLLPWPHVGCSPTHTANTSPKLVVFLYLYWIFHSIQGPILYFSAINSTSLFLYALRFSC